MKYPLGDSFSCSCQPAGRLSSFSCLKSMLIFRRFAFSSPARVVVGSKAWCIVTCLLQSHVPSSTRAVKNPSAPPSGSLTPFWFNCDVLRFLCQGGVVLMFPSRSVSTGSGGYIQNSNVRTENPPWTFMVQIFSRKVIAWNNSWFLFVLLLLWFLWVGGSNK